MKTSPILRLLALVLAFGLVAAACGGDDDGGDDALAAALESEMRDSGEVPEGFGDADISCLASAMSKAVGGESGLKDKYGISISEFADLDEDTGLTQGDAEKLVDGLDGCISIAQMIADTMVDDGLDQDSADCLAKAIDNDLLKDSMVAAFTGNDAALESGEFIGAMQSAALECGLG